MCQRVSQISLSRRKLKKKLFHVIGILGAFKRNLGALNCGHCD